jgi:shikimate dehydrogenase
MKKFKLCLVGYPLKKSFSPLVFEKIAKLCNIKIDFDLIEVKDTDPLKILSLNYDGFFITIPYKKTFYQYTNPDNIARELKIINCIKKHRNSFYSTNTDYKAIVTLSRKIDLAKKSATILGNGSIAYVSTYFLIKKGIKKIRISARNHKNSSEIIELLKRNSLYYELLKFPQTNNSDIIINATPMGMYFEEKIKLNKDTKFVIDFAYTKGNTELIKNCLKNKIKCISGIEILVMQALYGFKFITSIDIKKYYTKITEELI